METGISVQQFTLTTLAAICGCEVQAMTPETDVTDLGMDSMGLTVFAAHVEAAYDCQLRDEQVLELFQTRRIRDLVSLVEVAIARPCQPIQECERAT